VIDIMTFEEDIIKKGKKRWKLETSIYHERLNKIRDWSPIQDLSLTNKLPRIPLEYNPSPSGLEAVRISLYVMTNASIAQEVSRAFLILWRMGLTSTISLPVRQIYEIWGASHYSYKLLNEMGNLNDNNILKIQLNTARLLNGARSEVELPWGGLTNEKSIHVMDFIRELKDVCPEAEKTYDFLCESCHPSFIRLTDWSLAGPRLSNWDNNVFNNRGHKLLQYTLSAIEIALNGLALDTKNALELAMPIIRADAPDQAFMQSPRSK
jgi:hypothetical protein